MTFKTGSKAFSETIRKIIGDYLWIFQNLFKEK